MKFDKDILKLIVLVGDMGFTVAINLLFCVYIYKLYERFFGFSSIVFILLILFGVFTSFYNIYKIIKRK